MRKLSIGVAVTAVIVWGWLASTSYLLCRFSGHRDLYVFPWSQWPHLAKIWWMSTPTATILVGASAFVPTMVLFGILIPATLFFCAEKRVSWRQTDQVSNRLNQV